MSYSFIDLISGNECIGDSREKINDNFLNLETSVYLLSTDLGVVKIDLNVAKNDINTITNNLNILSSRITRCYSFYGIWDYPNKFTPITFGQPYESTHPAYPGGDNYLYLKTPSPTTGFKIEDTVLSIPTESNIGIDFVGWAAFDGTNNYINIEFAVDLSYDGGTTWSDERLPANGIDVPNAGTSASWGFTLLRPGNTTIKIRPKVRFQNATGSTAPTNWVIDGNFNVHIQPTSSLF